MKRYRSIRHWFIIILLILLLPVHAAAETLICPYLPALMKDFLSAHLTARSLNDTIKAHAVDQMLRRIDMSRTVLYEADAQKLRRDLMSMFDTMREGNCDALQDVHSLLVTRAKENEQFAKSFLGPDYKLDEAAELRTDPDKRPYPKTKAEKEDILRNVIHFQIANIMLAGFSLDEAKKQQIHRYELQTRRTSEQNAVKLVAAFAESFALALDPHSNYLSQENMEDLHIQLELSLEGIGASLSSENGFTVIESLIPGGSAERTGRLKPKDKIIAVAQEGEKPVNVIDMDLRDVIKMIRGKKGTKVTLTILRQAKRTSRFTVTIVRERIDIRQQEAKITYEKRPGGSREYVFGVINLPLFYGGDNEEKSSYKDVKRLLSEAEARKVDGIVLDLSRNGGGLLMDAVRIAGLFIDRGGVVATKNRQERIIVLANGLSSGESADGRIKLASFPGEDRAAVYTGPLVVLTSRLSASASEIVAGSLKDYRRAVIVGADHTYGKGSVQIVAEFPRGLGGMTVTTELYFLPGGRSTQMAGVAADVVLPSVFSIEEMGESALDYALPTQRILPFIYAPRDTSVPYPPWRPVDPSLIASLAVKSRARIAKSADFAEVAKTIQEIAGRKGIVRISDLRKDIEKENVGRKPGQATLEDPQQKADDQEKPYVAEGVNVLLDMITAERQAAAAPLN